MQKTERARRGLNAFVISCMDNGMKAEDIQQVMRNYLDEKPIRTPSSRWVVDGEPDPHGDRYDCERADLALGKMTDDELANEAFLRYDIRPPIQDIIDGKAYSPIMYMTAVKDRIRWLSRALDTALAYKPKVQQ